MAFSGTRHFGEARPSVAPATPAGRNIVAEEADATAHWYRRARWWLAAGVVAVVAVAVVLDVPTGASRSERQSAFSSWMATLDQDVVQCNAAMHDAIAIRFSANTSLAKTYTDTAINDCAFTDSGIVDLGGEQPPVDASSEAADQIAPAATKWADAYAVILMQELLVTISAPSDASAQRVLVADAVRLDRERAVVEGFVARAERGLFLPYKPLPLEQTEPLLEHR